MKKMYKLSNEEIIVIKITKYWSSFINKVKNLSNKIHKESKYNNWQFVKTSEVKTIQISDNLYCHVGIDINLQKENSCVYGVEDCFTHILIDSLSNNYKTYEEAVQAIETLNDVRKYNVVKLYSISFTDEKLREKENARVKVAFENEVEE